MVLGVSEICCECRPQYVLANSDRGRPPFGEPFFGNSYVLKPLHFTDGQTNMAKLAFLGI